MNVKVVTITVVLLLLFLAALQLGKEGLQSKKTPTPTPVPKQALPTRKERADTRLFAVPAKNEVAVGEAFTIAITTQTGKNFVTGFQLELSWDPTLLAIDEITPGDFFANPFVYANSQDNQKGEAVLALGFPDGKKGEGTVAIVKARALKKTQGGEILTIKPTSLVSEQENLESVLKSTKGAYLVIR